MRSSGQSSRAPSSPRASCGRRGGDMGSRVQGKVALITGAGSGIGAASARLFAEEGARVAAIGRRAETLEQWEGVDNVLPVLADITRPEDIERMFAETERELGPVDIVCNIAGIHDLVHP